MDGILLRALAQLPSVARDAPERDPRESTWRSPTDGASRRSEGPGDAAEAALGTWKMYLFPAMAILVVLAGLSLLCFSSKIRSWTQSCMCSRNPDEQGENGFDFDITWNIPIINQPEAYSLHVSAPQPVPRIRVARHFRTAPVHLPFAPKDLGIRTHHSSHAQTSADGTRQGSPSKTHGNGSGRGSPVEVIFKIEDLD